jgi:hypothetical protein
MFVVAESREKAWTNAVICDLQYRAPWRSWRGIVADDFPDIAKIASWCFAGNSMPGI